MVYKKFIEKNGKVVSDYYRSRKKSAFNKLKNYLIIFLGIGLFIFLFIWMFFLQNNYQGYAILDLQGEYAEDGTFNALLDVGLKQGELIPVNSILIIENEGNSYEYSLNELVDLEVVEGDYFVEGISISGEGEGYGVVGVSKKFPEVFFRLKVVSEPEVFEPDSGENSVTNSEGIVEGLNESNESEVVEESKTQEFSGQDFNETKDYVFEEEEEEGNFEDVEPEIISEDALIDQESDNSPEANDNVFESEEQPFLEEHSESQSLEDSENLEESLSPMTGNSVRGIFNIFRTTGKVTANVGEEISGEVTNNTYFKLNLDRGQSVEIIPGSVMVGNQTLSDNQITLNFSDKENGKKEVIVSTNYVLMERGFGEEYLGENVSTIFSINLSNLNLTFVPGNLNIKIIHEGKEIISYNSQIEEEVASKEDLGEDKNLNLSNETNSTLGEELNSTNASLIVQPVFLNEKDLEILIQNFGNSTISQTARIYKQWKIVKYSLGEYEVEYSYDSNLSNEVLDLLMENDKNNWLKDIIREILKEDSESTILANSTKNYLLN